MFVPVAFLLYLKKTGGLVEERRRIDVLHILWVDIIHVGREEEVIRSHFASVAEEAQAFIGDVSRLRKPVVATQL